MARPELRPAVFLAFAGVVIGTLALVLPLYGTPDGGSSWFLGQFPDASVRQTLGFALPSVGLLVLAASAAVSLAAATSRKVAGGVFLALGSFAALTVGSRLLLGAGLDGRGWTLVGLTLLEALCFLGAGWIVSRPAS